MVAHFHEAPAPPAHVEPEAARANGRGSHNKAAHAPNGPRAYL